MLTVFRFFSEVLILFYVTDKIFEKKSKKGIVFGIILTLETLLYYVFLTADFPISISLTPAYLMLAAIHYFAMKKYYAINYLRYIFIILVVLITKGIFSILFYLLYAFFEYGTEMQTTWSFLADPYTGVFIRKLMFFISIALFTEYYKKYETHANNFYRLIIFALSMNVFVFYTNLKQLFIMENMESIFSSLSIISLNLLFSSIFIIIISSNIIKHQSLEEKLNNEVNKYKDQVDYYKHFDEINNKIRAQRHDFINQIIVIKELINEGCINETKEYLEDIVCYTKEINEVIDIKHKILSALVNQKKRIMDSKNIVFEHMIQVPDEIHVDDIDLTGILGNALDNAIEACSETNIMEINLYMNYEMGRLKIVLENTFSGELKIKAGKLITTKGKDDERGIGMLSIEQIVKKYQGYMNIRTNGNVFFLEVLV